MIRQLGCAHHNTTKPDQYNGIHRSATNWTKRNGRGVVIARLVPAAPQIGVYQRLVLPLATQRAAIPSTVSAGQQVTRSIRARHFWSERLSRYLGCCMRYMVSPQRALWVDYPARRAESPL